MVVVGNDLGSATSHIICHASPVIFNPKDDLKSPVTSYFAQVSHIQFRGWIWSRRPEQVTEVNCLGSATTAAAHHTEDVRQKHGKPEQQCWPGLTDRTAIKHNNGHTTALEALWTCQLLYMIVKPRPTKIKDTCLGNDNIDDYWGFCGCKSANCTSNKLGTCWFDTIWYY